MRKSTAKCALLAALVAKHGWGAPIPEEQLLTVAAIERSKYRTARRAFQELKATSYVTNRGKRGIELDTGAFDRLADVLYHECDWRPFEIRIRLKHYEGWENHDWA